MHAAYHIIPGFRPELPNREIRLDENGGYNNTSIHLYVSRRYLLGVPISINEFEAHDPESHQTNAEKVIKFLALNHDQAFKASEIAEATSVHTNSIHPVLNRLEERGLVRHRAPYWAIGDREAIEDAAILHETTVFLDRTLGPENEEEWLQAANNAQSEEP